MNILYAIQGTGNGHISRALELIPVLKRYAQVDLLISGSHAELPLPFPIKYRLKGLGFVFGRKGGVDIWTSFKKNNVPKYLLEIFRLPVEKYDLVLSDFEPVSAWSCLFKNVPCVSLSHQSAVLSPAAPKPKTNDPFGVFVLKNYAPFTHSYGFHFEPFGENIFTPVIKKEIRTSSPARKNHYTVYLPAYGDEKIISVLKHFPGLDWHVFSKHTRRKYEVGSVSIRPVDAHGFTESMVSATGIVSGAGFETPAEAIHLKKKLLVVPMSYQYEQQCNAATLKQMGVPVLKSFSIKYLSDMKKFVEHDNIVVREYPDITERVIEKVLDDYSRQNMSDEYDYLAKYLDQITNAIRFNELAGKLKYLVKG